VHTGFWWGKLKERVHLKDLSIDTTILKMDLNKMGKDGVDWINLAQDRDKWWAPVNSVMIIQVTQNVGDFTS
jgi:hypothetical protein